MYIGYWTLNKYYYYYLRPLIHTTQNFKWSRYTLTTLNISQLKASIYLLETVECYHKTFDTDIHHCIQHITNIPHSVLTGDVNAHSTLWHSYTDDHKGQLIADVISNSDHITLNTTTRVPNTTLQQTSSPYVTTVSDTLYNRTSWDNSTHTIIRPLHIITTINMRYDYRLQQNRRTFTNYKKADWTQFTEDTEYAFAQTTIPTNIHTIYIYIPSPGVLMRSIGAEFYDRMLFLASTTCV